MPVDRPTTLRGSAGGAAAGGRRGAAYVLKVHQWALPTVDTAGDSALWPAWLKQQVKYEPSASEPPPPPPPARDPNAERWAQLQRG